MIILLLLIAISRMHEKKTDRSPVLIHVARCIIILSRDREDAASLRAILGLFCTPVAECTWHSRGYSDSRVKMFEMNIYNCFFTMVNFHWRLTPIFNALICLRDRSRHWRQWFLLLLAQLMRLCKSYNKVKETQNNKSFIRTRIMRPPFFTINMYYCYTCVYLKESMQSGDSWVWVHIL